MTDRDLLELVLNKVTAMEERFTGIEEQMNHIKETMATKEDVAVLPFIERAVQDTADTVKKIEAT